jgi:hypothetical protein
MHDKTTILATTSAEAGFKINNKKTELMKIITTSNILISVGGSPPNQRSTWKHVFV